LARPQDVVAELHARELHREDMTVAVCGDLMPAVGNLPYERGFPLRHPTENEECGAKPTFRQEIHDDARRLHDPPRETLPVSAWKHRPQVLRVEPLLDVERQEARQQSASADTDRKSPAHRAVAPWALSLR